MHLKVKSTNLEGSRDCLKSQVSVTDRDMKSSQEGQISTDRDDMGGFSEEVSPVSP